jgi:hypothetical protein
LTGNNSALKNRQYYTLYWEIINNVTTEDRSPIMTTNFNFSKYNKNSMEHPKIRNRAKKG